MHLVCFVVGARPNFMKAAPVLRALAGSGDVETLLVHTGQHYDDEMSDVFLRELGLPTPDVSLNVGSGTHAEQTGRRCPLHHVMPDRQHACGRHHAEQSRPLQVDAAMRGPEAAEKADRILDMPRCLRQKLREFHLAFGCLERVPPERIRERERSVNAAQIEEDIDGEQIGGTRTSDPVGDP